MTSSQPSEGRRFWSPEDIICVAGKNEVAVDCLAYLVEIGVPRHQLCVTGNKGDTGTNTWQPSLVFAADKHGIRVVSQESLHAEKNLWFLSLEYDRLIRPAKFASRRLYNMHFSLLPAYRGVSTSVWPILNAEKVTGVTFHEIDAGIDSGPVLLNKSFEIADHWTARDLYFAYQANGAALFREFVRVLADPGHRKVPQDESKASLYMRKDINFRDIQVDLTAPAARIHDKLRAFTFWEYQLPKVAGREVWRSRLLEGGPTGSPGAIRKVDAWRSVVSGADGDVELTFSPYADLFSWAAGQAGVMAPAWAAVPNLDLQNAKGWSALMVAAFNGRIDEARALVAAGASVDGANLRGTTPLMYAFTRMLNTGDSAVFSYLLSVGADSSRRDAKGLSISDYLPPEKRGDLRKLFPSIFQ